MNFMGIFTEVLEKVPRTVHCGPRHTPFPLNARQCAHTLHRSRPPEKKMRSLPDEIPGFP
jgi:hypothetical protein